MARSPITDSLKRVNEAIAWLQNNLNPGEIDLLLDELAPLPEPTEQPAPKKRKTRKGGKSARAKSIGAQLQQTRQLDGGVNKMRCSYASEDGDDPTACGEYADANVHHLESVDGYHEFQAAKAEGASA